MEFAVEPGGKQLVRELPGDYGADRDEMDAFGSATHDGVASSMELPTTCTMAADYTDSKSMDAMALQLSTILIWFRYLFRPSFHWQMHTVPMRKCKEFSTTEMNNKRIEITKSPFDESKQ